MALRFAHLQFTTTRSEMKVSSFLRGATTALFIAASALLPVSANAQSAPAGGLAEKWMFTATLYGWVPTIDGKVNFAEDRGSTGIHASMSDVLTHLRMTFQGTLDAHNGRWGMFTDVVYVDVAGVKSNERDFSIGNIGIPATATADLDLTIKALVWTVAGEYRVASDPAWTVDVLGGARLLQMKPRLGYSITGDIGGIVLPGGRSGSKQVDESVWDGIVGVKGRYTFGDDRKWYAPFYLDVGTGQTQLTWQIAGGIGYSYNWGSVFAMWRYLDYNFASGKKLEDITMNGPMLGVAFRW
jgi:hypothetical protein